MLDSGAHVCGSWNSTVAMATVMATTRLSDFWLI
jgi:hypothetical protein